MKSTACTIAAVVLGLVLVSNAGCGQSDEVRALENPPATLDVPPDHPYAGPRLAEFELLECHGATVTLEDLLGQPCVIDFIFTTCAGPCPTMSASMAQLQRELEHTATRLISVTVDPETDDAATLRSYAEVYGADPERWWFLTGEESQMAALAASVYLAVVPAEEEDAILGFQVAHATKLVVVDGEGVVRGYYDGQTPAGVQAAAARVRFLADDH